MNTIIREATAQVFKSNTNTNFKSHECAKNIKHQLEAVTEYLEHCRINAYRQCMDSDGDSCWLLRNLQPWNDILHFVDLEIKEERPGKVTLQTVEVVILVACAANYVTRAALVVYILLRNHRCVERIHLVNDVVSNTYPFLVAHGLLLSKGLHHIKITSSSLPESFGDYLSAALKKMSALESLEINRIKLSRDVVGRIADVIRGNCSLESVRFMENDMTELEALSLLRSLSCSPRLKILCIDNSYLSQRGADMVSRILSTSQTITELSLKFIRILRTQDSNQSSSDITRVLDDELFVPMVRPLKKNTTLRKIEFSGSSLTTKAVKFLAQMLQHNESLQFLHLADCNMTDDHGEALSQILEHNQTLLEIHLQDNRLGSKGAKALMRGISKNMSLRVLRLDSNQFDTRGIEYLATSLQENTTLEKLALGYFECKSYKDSERLTKTLRLTNALGRMQISYDVHGFLALIASLGATNCILTEVNIHSDLELESEHLRELFRTLVGVQGLKTVIFDAAVPFDDAAAVKVTKFLAVCQTLKHFHLNTTSAESTVFPILAQGLKRNQSIKHLEMEYCARDGFSAFEFFDLLKENCKICYLSYLRTSLQYLQMLPDEMDSNYTLETLKVHEEAEFKPILSKVYAKQRQNVSLMKRALEFVLNHRVNQQMAEAYERLRDTKCFRTRLKEVAEIDDDKVEALFKSARSFIVEHYLPITRIVKRSLVCHPAQGRTQIDQLDYHAWFHIFSYLNVRDVVNT